MYDYGSKGHSARYFRSIFIAICREASIFTEVKVKSVVTSVVYDAKMYQDRREITEVIAKREFTSVKHDLKYGVGKPVTTEVNAKTLLTSVNQMKSQ